MSHLVYLGRTIEYPLHHKKSQLQFSAQRSRAGKVARHDLNLRKASCSSRRRGQGRARSPGTT
ncbi:hypothetical protein J6590_040564 [Homalodisca vitripennis]|nr:hypothetical protein J6590_040564 [Homalodisca vitripennis]